MFGEEFMFVDTKCIEDLIAKYRQYSVLAPSSVIADLESLIADEEESDTEAGGAHEGVKFIGLHGFE